ncbi:Ankyrin repeat domain-containing protein 13B [Papilio xuthus]|uniref:Ankyrin repeat domain-containing protein 13B n=1 Tax=Papilio xuthus TaxID=66420 RepID=A0A194Q7H5_PAPXU|nr:Ankyrin repeat domain-containing protein 13B [Papilio xuthus]
MPLNVQDVAKRFPIHWLVWNNEHEELKSSLEANKFTKEDIELRDPRGRTPLLLAVTLGHIEAVEALINAGADVNCEKDGWTAVQEATARGDAALLSLVLSRRDRQRQAARAAGVPDLLRRLSLAPDFYVEMKWEFTSWVPLVSRYCPFDTYKVYKRGGNVRVDTTLAGFDDTNWQRGERSYIFRGQGNCASLVELDHTLGTSWCEQLDARELAAHHAPPRRALLQRLAAPLALNYLDTDKISFERNKSGIWGWRQDKTETVNGYECKVFSANNVELVSKTRSEHVPRGERARATPRAPLAGLLALADREGASPLLTPEQEEVEEEPHTSRSSEEKPVTWSEYFSDVPLERDIGRPKEMTTKVQKFKATLWLCEDYPLEVFLLQEQIMPILDLMTAISSPHFAKLKDFIQMQLPAGFPVKIEIPLFHVVNARITFGNIFATESPVPNIECIQEGERLSCIVDDACFEIGRGYRDAAVSDDRMSSGTDDDEGLLQYAIQQSLMEAGTHDDQVRRGYRDAAVSDDRMSSGTDDDEGLLQYAIQQSLMEAGTHDDQVDVWEALRGARPSSPAPPRALLAAEERQLQRAIEASLSLLTPEERAEADAMMAAALEVEVEEGAEGEAEAELRAALELSAREHAELDRRRQDEERALDEVLRLSLIDK